jgi:hypothetical protein
MADCSRLRRSLRRSCQPAFLLDEAALTSPAQCRALVSPARVRRLECQACHVLRNVVMRASRTISGRRGGRAREHGDQSAGSSCPARARCTRDEARQQAAHAA